MPQPSVSCHYWPDWDVHLACQSKVYECVTSKEERNIGREQSGIVLIYQNLKTFSRSLSLCNSQILPQIQPAINLSMIMRWSLLCFTLSFYLLLVKGFGDRPDVFQSNGEDVQHDTHPGHRDRCHSTAACQHVFTSDALLCAMLSTELIIFNLFINSFLGLPKIFM